MPTPGLSLVGFLDDQQLALNHLKVTCMPAAGKSDQDILLDWQAAKAALGNPFPNYGNPQIAPIAANDPRLAQVIAQVNLTPWAIQMQSMLAQGASFQMVEIEPLLAFQLSVDKDHSGTKCGTLGAPPSEDELFAICLPSSVPQDNIHSSRQGQSIIIKSRSLNLVTLAEGPLQAQIPTIGIQFWWALPFVHVVRYKGRCYLHNGYHRAYGLRLAGATRMPCMFRDVATAAEAGIRTDGGTFTEAVLTSANPPTMAHYTNGRAMDVQLRRAIRILQINWSQHAFVDEPD